MDADGGAARGPASVARRTRGCRCRTAWTFVDAMRYAAGGGRGASRNGSVRWGGGRGVFGAVGGFWGQIHQTFLCDGPQRRETLVLCSAPERARGEPTTLVEVQADRVFEGDKVFAQDVVIDDVVFVDGAVRFRGSVNGQGTVVATGDVRLDTPSARTPSSSRSPTPAPASTRPACGCSSTRSTSPPPATSSPGAPLA